MVLADERLYVVTRFDGVSVLAAKPQYAQISHNSLEDARCFNPGPTVANGKLLLRSEGYLFCIGTRD